MNYKIDYRKDDTFDFTFPYTYIFNKHLVKDTKLLSKLNNIF